VGRGREGGEGGRGGQRHAAASRHPLPVDAPTWALKSILKHDQVRREGSGEEGKRTDTATYGRSVPLMPPTHPH